MLDHRMLHQGAFIRIGVSFQTTDIQTPLHTLEKGANMLLDGSESMKKATVH